MNSIPGVFSAIFCLCLESGTQVSWMCSISVTCWRTVWRKCRQGPMTFFPQIHSQPCEHVFFWKDSWSIFLSTVTTQKWGAGALHCLNMTPQLTICCKQTEANAMACGKQWSYVSKSTQQHKFHCAKTKQGSEDRSHHSKSPHTIHAVFCLNMSWWKKLQLQYQLSLGWKGSPDHLAGMIFLSYSVWS